MDFSFPVELFFIIPFVISLISVIVSVLLEKDKNGENNYLEEDETLSGEQDEELSFHYTGDLHDINNLSKPLRIDRLNPAHPAMYYTIYDKSVWDRWDE